MPKDKPILAIVGSREYPRADVVRNIVKRLHANVEVISGGARGVDTWAIEAAKERGLAFRVFPADWATHGRRAGYVRNIAMAMCTEYVLAFWDEQSKGTMHMWETCQGLGKPGWLIGARAQFIRDTMLAAQQQTLLNWS